MKQGNKRTGITGIGVSIQTQLHESPLHWNMMCYWLFHIFFVHLLQCFTTQSANSHKCLYVYVENQFLVVSGMQIQPVFTRTVKYVTKIKLKTM